MFYQLKESSTCAAGWDDDELTEYETVSEMLAAEFNGRSLVEAIQDVEQWNSEGNYNEFHLILR